MRLRTALAALFMTVAVAAAGAQDTSSTRTWPPWRTSYFPYATRTPNDGIMGIARLVRFRQAASDDRVSLHSALAFEAGYSTRDSWRVGARADFPRIAAGWRVAGAVEARREEHLGHPADDLRSARINGWVDVTRQLTGPLLLAVRVSADESRFGGGTNLYERYPRSELDFGGIDEGEDGYPLEQTDLQARGALVLDLRDREYNTRRGALIEAGLFVGGAGDGYTGGYVLATGYAALRETTHLTARVGLRAVSETGAAAILQEIPGWEQPFAVLGGSRSHRALGVAEMVGRGVLMAGAEARQEVISAGNIMAVTLLGFVDAGRVFRDPSPLVDPVPGAAIESGELNLTLEGWTVGAGGGVAVRILRNAQLTLTAARARSETRVYLGAGAAW